MISLMVVGGSTKSADDDNITTRMNGAVIENAEDNYNDLDDIEQKDGTKVRAEDAHVFPVTTATIIFQLLLIFASIYYAMMLTNWGNPSVFTDTTDFFKASKTSFWVKQVAQWVSIGIYLFSLLAPLIFPDREF